MKKFIISLALVGFLMTSCQKDFLDTTPEEYISDAQLAENPASLQAILNGIYANLRSYTVGNSDGFHVDFGHKAMTAATDLMSNDIAMTAFHWYGNYYNFGARTQTNNRNPIYWNTYYSQLADANSIINSIDPSTTDEGAKAILGQALSLKAMCVFALVRTYAPTYIGNENAPGIPLPDGIEFDGKPRSPLNQIYDEIIADMELAVNLLANFQRATKQEINQQVAQGLLARIYLETGNWTGAAQMANAARQGYAPMSGEEWFDGFSNINNPEWMWGADIDAESSTVFASFFSHFDNTNSGYAGALGVYKSIDANLYQMIPEGDLRKDAFVAPEGNPNFPSFPAYTNLKFRDPSFFEGDYVYMRAGEMWLIEAEALARSGNDDQAAEVLYEVVSPKFPGYEKTAATGDDLVNEIYLQRRIELWGEGFSFFDMKRFHQPLDRIYDGTNHIVAGQFEFPADSPKFVWQLPEDEINANDAISPGDQNPL